MSFLFKTIRMQDIKLKVSKTQIIFSYEFGDKEKNEKALNLAGGRIHRRTTAGSGVWTLEGKILYVTYDFKSSHYTILSKEVLFKDIAELFEEMVKS